MNYKNCFLVVILLIVATAMIAQRDDIVLTKEKKEFAYNSIKELKDGALVVRLHTNHRKIQQLEMTLASSKLTKNQRKRHEGMLEGTIKRRDEFNIAIASMFADSFRFCPVYLMYDTNSTALTNGTRTGIFLNSDRVPDPTITLQEPHVFIVNYMESGSDFPFDVLRVRKLKEKLDEPFPYYAALRESWINPVNTPRAKSAVAELDRRFRRFYAQALKYDEKQEEKEIKKEENEVKKAKE